ncbi:MAG: hypothetical protein K9L30_17715 [Desulfobacterales bacterium]|nr:hypothetical protein [Desulfobacterales bacterium]
MRFRGVLDKSLGNFLCLRGYAKMGDLYEISEAKEYQRGIDQKHKKEVREFVKKGKFHFYPEIILGAVLARNDPDLSIVEELFYKIDGGEKFKSVFEQLSIQCTFTRSRSTDEERVYDYFRRAQLTIDDDLIGSGGFEKFSRIDGNHRLSIINPRNQRFKNINTPFCIVFFRDESEAEKFGAALFHNINHKAKPLTMEENLKLILGDKELFPDDELKESPSFGWPYYLARRLHGNIDYEMAPHIQTPLENCERTFLVDEFTWLIEAEVLGENENASRRFKQALAEINTLYAQYVELKESKNRGLLGAFIYFQLQPENLTESFLDWVIENHIYTIEKSHSKDLVKVFGSILKSRGRTLFVSMKFNHQRSENHYRIIERVANEINTEFNLQVKLKPQRVDWFVDGTSYEINNKILKMISDCGLLIGNLTFCNPNVYHEIGFLMGKARATGEDFGNFILFLDESVDNQDKYVGFNLAGIKQIRFSESETFASELKKNLIKYFKL